MALNTEISWCDHTLNLWWGCFKVSPGCKFCYADTLDNRYNHENRHWGPSSKRKMVRSWWKNLNDMNKSAISNNRRETVFVMSMGDIFEDDQPLSNNEGTAWKTIDELRQEFFRKIPQYPNLIFLLLTKRPENVLGITPISWIRDWPENVWIGTSIVNQEEVFPRLDALSNLPLAANTFVSMEPLLGPAVLGEMIAYADWVIVGGESGQKARPMNPDWVRALRDETLAAGKPFHFKQWGENYPIESSEVMAESIGGEPIVVKSLKFEKRGKMNSGKTLDGNIIQQFPESFHKPLRVTV